MKKREMALGKQISFAIEMVRGALRQMSMSDILLETNIELPRQSLFNDRYIPITSVVLPGMVYADCFVSTEKNPHWGDIEIRFFPTGEATESRYRFHCELTNNQLVVR